MTKCDRREGVAKIGKKHVTYFMDSPCLNLWIAICSSCLWVNNYCNEKFNVLPLQGQSNKEFSLL